MRVLAVADDPAIDKGVRRRLWRDGHIVDIVPDGPRGLEWAGSGTYDAVILDLMLLGGEGIALTRRVRSDGLSTPILVLTARGALRDRLAALDAGADDCLTRPFVIAELVARLRAITRRSAQPVREECLRVDDLVLDPGTRVVTRAGQVLALAPRELALLDYMMRHRGQVLGRGALLAHVWGYDADPVANAVDAAVWRLRQAVDAGRPALIHTVRHVGYKIDVN